MLRYRSGFPLLTSSTTSLPSCWRSILSMAPRNLRTRPSGSGRCRAVGPPNRYSAATGVAFWEALAEESRWRKSRSSVAIRERITGQNSGCAASPRASARSHSSSMSWTRRRWSASVQALPWPGSVWDSSPSVTRSSRLLWMMFPRTSAVRRRLGSGSSSVRTPRMYSEKKAKGQETQRSSRDAESSPRSMAGRATPARLPSNRVSRRLSRLVTRSTPRSNTGSTCRSPVPSGPLPSSRPSSFS